MNEWTLFLDTKVRQALTVCFTAFLFFHCGFHHSFLVICISLQRLTPWNAGNLRDAIINGSEIHPGATHYVDKLSTVKLPPSKKTRISISRKLPSSRGVVTQYGKSCDYEFEGKTVYRHLRDGDVVLVNRQVLRDFCYEKDKKMPFMLYFEIFVMKRIRKCLDALPGSHDRECISSSSYLYSTI